jgi:hypothetical protein
VGGLISNSSDLANTVLFSFVFLLTMQQEEEKKEEKEGEEEV